MTIFNYIFILLISFNLAAQDDYYYYKGRKINIPLKKEQSKSKYSSYSVKESGKEPIQISDIFYVKLKKKEDIGLLRKVANEKGVSVIHQNKFMPLWYKLKLSDKIKKSSVEISNEFYESGYFSDIDPAFMFNFQSRSTNDSNFGDLWGLQNQTNPNVDINALEAWSISEGEGTTVAVLDQGIDKWHDELKNNTLPISYDCQADISPALFRGNHGTHVSGIIAAEKDNNLQVVGVAPKSNLIDVSHSLLVSPSISEELANGINWAVLNGADIINNSWGDQGGIFYNDLHSSLLEDAITNAIVNGRNGLGTILVFCSGNRAPNIDYPGNFHDDALVVGSINSLGIKAESSAYGTDLDVVAPGVSILSTVAGQNIDVRSGTSMAAPHVTGVAALILSINPNLTVKEVNTIIETSAQKMEHYGFGNNDLRPNGTWNEEVGYGLVDAHAAVKMARESANIKLEGVDVVCYAKEKTMNLKNNYTSDVNWKVSSNIKIISSSSNAAVIEAAEPTSTGKGWIKAILDDGKILRDDFEVGIPKYDQGRIEVHPGHRGGIQPIFKEWIRMRLVNVWPYQRNTDWEWNIEYSMVKPSTSRGITVRPMRLGNINMKARRKNECGCGEWISNTFIVK